MNILIAGVGGQGTLLTSKILGAYASAAGLECKLSEVHGMAQRGGSVVTHVKLGKEIFSPIISEGEADAVLAFEELEALRHSHFLRDGGKLVVSAQNIYPMPVITGAMKYPDNIHEQLSSKFDTYYVDAVKLSKEAAGTERSANIVMLGALTRRLELDYFKLQKALCSVMTEKFHEINLKAFESGYKQEGWKCTAD